MQHRARQDGCLLSVRGIWTDPGLLSVLLTCHVSGGSEKRQEGLAARTANVVSADTGSGVHRAGRRGE